MTSRVFLPWLRASWPPWPSASLRAPSHRLSPDATSGRVGRGQACGGGRAASVADRAGHLGRRNAAAGANQTSGTRLARRHEERRVLHELKTGDKPAGVALSK